jgi:Rrf2 family protein
MRLSKRGEYGLRALLLLAREPGRDVRLGDIARREKIPSRFLEQIFLDLRGAGILRGRRGRVGGYRLARPARKITLGEIVRLLNGPLAPIRCVSRSAYEPCSCPSENECRLRAVMLEVRNAISRILDRTTLAELVGDAPVRKRKR